MFLDTNNELLHDIYHVSEEGVELHKVAVKRPKKAKIAPLDYILAWCNRHNIAYSAFQQYETLKYIKVVYANAEKTEIAKIIPNNFVVNHVLNR